MSATTPKPKPKPEEIFYSTGSCVGPRTAVDAIVEDCTNILEIGLEEFSLFPNPNNGNFPGPYHDANASYSDFYTKAIGPLCIPDPSRDAEPGERTGPVPYGLQSSIQERSSKQCDALRSASRLGK